MVKKILKKRKSFEGENVQLLSDITNIENIDYKKYYNFESDEVEANNENENNKFMQKNKNDFLNNNIGYKNNPFTSKNEYNLEEERNKLLQMASMKNLQKKYENKNKFKYNLNKDSPTSGVSDIVDQFFLRQLKNNNI